MKMLGVIVVCISGMLGLSCIRLVLTQYNMSDTHDVSKACFAFGVSVLILVAGLLLYQKGNNGPGDGAG